ncbi:MAG: hypothetical protein U0M12_02825 [Acutalibacteraceae bacterium]|nr:hypothetical protein [Acutalibacteraceae bacterium]
MSNKDLFKSTFSHLKVNEDIITEVIEMKENKKIRKFPAKAILVTAACIITLLCSGIAVNAATDGAIVGDIFCTTDYLGATYTYELKKIDDDTVLFWLFSDENNNEDINELLDEYTDKEAGTYYDTDSEGNEVIIVVEEDGSATISYDTDEVTEESREMADIIK